MFRKSGAGQVNLTGEILYRGTAIDAGVLRVTGLRRSGQEQFRSHRARRYFSTTA